MPHLTINYAQDIDTVYRFVTDPERIKERCEASGERNVRIQVEESGGTLVITSTREIDSDLPGFAKKLFSATNTIVERREWRDAGDKKTCRSHIDVVGTPGKIDSDVTISPSGSGCTYDIEFEVTAKVPLIRKKLEEFVAKSTMEGLREEHEFNQRELNAAG
jgi:formylmethanofuran dehydrogenase subunit E-like metal-binding protein